MKCPACSNSLSPKKFGAITLDICDGGCGGIWFDHNEFQKFDEKAEFAENPLLALPKLPGAVINREKIRHCPKCAGEELIRLWFDPNRQVELDQCLKCWGLWADTGELPAVRNQHETAEERQKASDSYLDTQFEIAGQALADETRAKLAQEYQRARPTLRNFFRDWFY